MFLSLNWLRDFVDIPNSLTPEELGVRLTMHTVEIDGVEKESDKYAGVVVGELLEVKVHPNADRLRLARVNIGKEELDIVCGAPNIEAGQKIPVALVGSVLPNGMEIKEAEIRGETSHGMLCAEDELGLGEDHSGIMILNEKAKVGLAFAEYLKLSDVIFEVDNKSITNRPDLWGHYGMAREISTFLGLKLLRNYEEKSKEDIIIDSDKVKFAVKIEDYDLCPRYMALAVDNIKVEDSPKWLSDRLIAVGVRPINNIVDISNYVMMELGQPMHAFDRNLVDRIIVRRAKENEKITTLDGEKRDLSAEDLVIADSKKAIAIAGVMGGENSEISNNTTCILLESANFNFLSARKTSGKFSLRTEASMRFEKSMDPNLCELAMVRAAELIKEIIPGAKIVAETIDENKFKIDQGPINVKMDWLNRFLGEELPVEEVLKILDKLGFAVKETAGLLEIGIPSWRATKDISIKEDIAEEVARIYGYDKLSPAMPKIKIATPEYDAERDFEKKARKTLSLAVGLVEVFNYSFVGEEQMDKMGIEHSDHLALANPITKNHTKLRQSLAPHLFTNIKTNQKRISKRGFYEIGSIFLSCQGDIEKDDEGTEKLPLQEKRLGIAYVNDNADDLLLDIKSEAIEPFLRHLNMAPVYARNADKLTWSDNTTATSININGKMVGTIDILDRKIAQKMGIKKKVAIAEFAMADLLDAYRGNEEKKFNEFDKYPPVIRDVAFVVSNKVLYSDIKKAITDFNVLITAVELFDVYQGEKIGEGKKNLAFRIYYQGDRTLTSEEVDDVQAMLVKSLEEKFEAKIRDY